MDLSPFISEFAKIVCFLIPVLLIVGLLKTPWFKGLFGEFLVNILASLFLNKKHYHILKNVTLPTKDGTTQIDHIIISKYGVFVVETKNMKGWIFGSAHQKTWTQKIYKHTNKFQNPLHQNFKHVETLKAALGLDDRQVHSLVVFVGDSTFKTPMPENVTYGYGFIRFIKSKTELVIQDEEVHSIIERIQSGRLEQSFKTHREHVAHVREIINSKRTKSV